MNIDFRSLIKDALERRGMSVPQLARLIGANHNTIYKWLEGGSDDTRYLGAILSALDAQITIPEIAIP